MTNREKLRQMTDEELAEWIDKNGTDSPCSFICEHDCPVPDDAESSGCQNIILAWLKAEATE